MSCVEKSIEQIEIIGNWAEVKAEWKDKPQWLDVLKKRLAYEAGKVIDAQNACSLSGLVYSLSTVCSILWDYARKIGKGTGFVNGHPIVHLYSVQISYLSGSGDSSVFPYVFDICEEIKSGKVDP